MHKIDINLKDLDLVLVKSNEIYLTVPNSYFEIMGARQFDELVVNKKDGSRLKLKKGENLLNEDGIDNCTIFIDKIIQIKQGDVYIIYTYYQNAHATHEGFYMVPAWCFEFSENLVVFENTQLIPEVSRFPEVGFLVPCIPNEPEQMKTTIELFDDVTMECIQIAGAKFDDYGPSFKALPLPSFTDQLYIKPRRIRQIQENI
nr:nucleotide modification associated domain-containing protein [Chitinophagales bacterium]